MNDWTPKTVFDIMGSDSGSDGWDRERRVADAHNAALATERENSAELKKQDEVHWKTRRTLLKQLAAEREKVKTLVETLEHCESALAAFLPHHPAGPNARAVLEKVKDGK